MLSSVSFFFPAHNEVDNVRPLVEEALAVLPRITAEFEILIVDDGSRDGTAELADALAAEYPQVRAIHNATNLGYGGAVKRGFAESRMDWIFFTDGDRQFRLDELPDFAKRAQTTDMVIGYRRKRNDPPHRLLNAKMYGTMVKTLFGFKARDIDCAYKLISRRVMDKVKLDSGGALISAELLAKAHNCGVRWAELPVNHYPREAGKQSGANLRVIVRMFRELFRNYKGIKSYRPQ